MRVYGNKVFVQNFTLSDKDKKFLEDKSFWLFGKTNDDEECLQ